MVFSRFSKVACCFRKYDPEPEAMVQLVLTFIAKEGSRREAPDDRAALAAALRMRHGEFIELRCCVHHVIYI